MGDKLSKVVPNRRGLVVSDAWMELEDHVRTLLVLESLRAKLPWRTSMVQMLEISERLLEKTANFGRVETDACIWGAGGVNMKVREFFRMVHPEWVRDQIKHAMAAGLDETTARCFTIALVELVAVFLSQVFWAGRTNEMGMIWDIWNVVDNTNTQAWMEKLWAGPLLASKYLRGMAVLGMRRKYNCATTGERTKFMHFADPLSRVWEKGVYDPTAMGDFADACRTAGVLDGMREIVVTRELLDKHAFPSESFAAVSLKAQVQSMLKVADSPKFETVEWDPENDKPLKHCLQELPMECKDKGTPLDTDSHLLAADSPQPTTENPHSDQLPKGNPQVAEDNTQLAMVEEAAVVAAAKEMEVALDGGANEIVPPAPKECLGNQPLRVVVDLEEELGCLVEPVWEPPAGGGHSHLWSLKGARSRSETARDEWKQKIQAQFYTQASARTKLQLEQSQTGFTEAELHPLLPQDHLWSKQPTFTAICYGILGSAMGWIGEGFKLIAGSEIDPWCVDHASRLVPGMLQLGDLEKMTVSSMPVSDVLIVGTTCTAVSVLGMLRGLADVKMKHMLMVARLAVQIGYKAMVWEMVPNILGYDGGAIQLAFENIFRAAGYEVSRRVECLYPHGGGAVRLRLYTVVTNPCYGSHSNLSAVTQPLRQPTDPANIADVIDPAHLADSELFHDLKQVKWKGGEIYVKQGKPCWLGSMYGGGIGYRGIPGRVLLWLSALTTVIGSGNVGAILGKSSSGQWYLRELDAHELKVFNTLCAVQELPTDKVQAFRAVGNCEPPRMAQAMARGVVGPWLRQAADKSAGETPIPTPWRQTLVGVAKWSDITALGEETVSVREQLSRMRPRLKESLPEATVESDPVPLQVTAANKMAARDLLEKCKESASNQWKCDLRQQPGCGTEVIEHSPRFSRGIAGTRFSRDMAGHSRRSGAPKGARSLHRSGVEKLYPKIDAESPHDRQQARKQDPNIVEALAQVESSILRPNTNVKYKGQFDEYLAHCVDFGEDPFQSGKSTRQITEHMVYFVMYRFEYAKNKFGTIRGYLSAIRWHFLEAELEDPTKGGRLLRVMRGIKNLRGDVKRKLPTTVPMVLWIWRRRGKGLSKYLATATAAVVSFFLLLRIGAVAAQDSRTIASYVLKRHQVTFCKAGVRCSWKDTPDEVQLNGEGDKVSNEPWFRNHFASGAELCPVAALVEWFKYTDGLVAGECPLFTVPSVGKPKVLTDAAVKFCVTRGDVAEAVKMAAIAQGDLAADYGTHSNRIGGATRILQCGGSASLVKLAGKWSSDTWKIYSRLTSTVMYGVSADMANVGVTCKVAATEVQ